LTKYTVIEYLCAKEAGELQNIIGKPSTKELNNCVDKNLIPNACKTHDILRAEDIFGPKLRLLEGKIDVTPKNT